ncbi:MAG: PD-(D/E)XK nuclease family protein [Verrucomicrobiota bacterium]
MNLPKSLNKTFWSSPNDSSEEKDLLNIPRFKKLLKDFVRLPKTTRSKTFFEISGNPHYEIYCSNFLKFWFSTDADHGFGDTILFSLLSLIEPNIRRNSLKNVEVFREEPTEKDGQLDLVIRSEDLVVGIENKIFAHVQNDLEDYSRHLEKSGKKCLKILLCLNKLRPDEKKRAEDFGFKIVTYDQFFKQVLNAIGSKMATANMHYVGLLLDFIATMENLKRGTYMNAELLEFFKNYEEEIRQLCCEAVPKLTSDLKAKGEPVKDFIKENKLPSGISDLTWHEAYDAACRNVFSYTICCKADLGNSRYLGLEAVIQLTGWKIIAWPVDDQSAEPTKQFVDKSGIRFKATKDFWTHAEFPYEENIESVAKKFQELIENVSSRLPNKKGSMKRC